MLRKTKLNIILIEEYIEELIIDKEELFDFMDISKELDKIKYLLEKN